MNQSGTASQRHLLAANLMEFAMHGAEHSSVAREERDPTHVPMRTPAVDIDHIMKALALAERRQGTRHVDSERERERRASEAGEDRERWGSRTLGAIQNVFAHMQDGFHKADNKMTRHHGETTRMMAAQDENLTMRLQSLNDTLGKAGLLLFGLQLFGLADLGKLIGRPRSRKFKSKRDLEDGGDGLTRREVESLLQKMNKLHMAMHVQNHDLNELKKLVKTKQGPA
jgi:hypothetical protein